MRYIDELPTGKAKKAFLLNLESKRKSHLASSIVSMRRALKNIQKDMIHQIGNAGSLSIMEEIAKQPMNSLIIKQGVTDIYKRVGADFAKESFKNVGGNMKADVDVMRDIWEREMETYVNEFVGNRITLITNTTEDNFKKIVRNVVNEAQQKGLSVDDAAKMIRQRIGFDSQLRAVRIARTEIVSSSNHGSLVGAKSTRLQLEKVWLATKTGNTRHSHKNADGQTVDIDGKFTIEKRDSSGALIGTEELEHPGDPNGSAGNVIQCRCTQVYRRKY